MSLHDLSLFLSSKILPLAFSIIGFGLLVVVHELGHFMFCKLFSIHTPTFSVGFGKPLIERKIGTTNFRIARIPLGGYVEIAGLQEVAQGDQEFAKATGDVSFADKPFWQKFLVLMGGIIFNLLFAYGVFCSLFIIGTPGIKKGITISYVVKKSAAQKAELKEGDVILGVNGKLLVKDNNPDLTQAQKTLLTQIRNNPNKQISILIDRDGKQLEKQVLLSARKDGDKEIGSLGSHLSVPILKLPLWQAIKMGVKTTNMWIYNIAKSLKALFQKRTLDGAGGPVMIFAMGFKTAQTGFLPFLLFFAIMSINLALFNLLPLGITDGGQLMFAGIEAIIRRPVPEAVRIAVNVISLGLFALLFVYLTYKDVYMLFGKTIGGLYERVVGLFR